MTDKVQKIKEWIGKEQDGFMDAQGNFDNPSDEGAFHILTNLDYYIDSLQEENVSIWHDASEKPERDDLLIETNDGRIIYRQSIIIMEKIKKIEVSGKMYNLSDVDKINVREKATMEEIPFIQWLRKTFKFIK